MTKMEEHPHLALIARLFRLLEQGGDEAALAQCFTPDVTQREFANRLVPRGAERGLADLLEGHRRGKQVVQNQRFAIESALIDGDRVAVEVTWTAELKVPLGQLRAGDTMTAHSAMFFRIVGGRIAEQHNFDCFEPF